MIIKILQDNTVHVRYSDGTEQTLNSTHSHKAVSPTVKAVADALPYKGAMEFTEDYVAPVFVLEKGEIVCGDKCFCHDADVSGETPEIQAFVTALYSNPEVVELCQLVVLEDEEDYQAFDIVPETQTTETIEIIEGKAIDVVKVETVDKEVPLFDFVPRFNADGVPLVDIYEVEDEDEDFWEEEEGPKMHPVPRMVTGKKVSDKDKARLAELIAKL